MKMTIYSFIKRLFVYLLFCFIIFTNGQVGIGNSAPRGALDINKPTTHNMGLVLPTNTSTSNIINPQGGNVAEGTVIYDNAMKCVKVFNGTAWSNCLCDACGATPPSVTADCNGTGNGFSGTFIAGVTLSNAKYTVTITNNSFSTVAVGFQNSDLTLSGISGITVSSTSPTSISLAAGQSQAITYNLSGTPATVGNITGSWTKLTLNCSNTVAVQSGAVNSLNCTAGALTGNVIDQQPASGVTKVINYTAAGTYQYPALSFPSTGATGLTMSAPAGSMTGTGSITFTISGTTNIADQSQPTTATFNVAIGGQTCTFTIPIGITAKCGPTDVTPVIEITSSTGKVWMDRNLGAKRAAQGINDYASYGCYYQWGRLSDGHADVTYTSGSTGNFTATTATTATSTTPGNALFITGNNWLNTNDNTLWQGINGTNNPCPAGFRIPTQPEVQAEATAYGINNSATAFASPLKIPATGRRNNVGNFLSTEIAYWTSTPTSGYTATSFVLTGFIARNRTDGNAVRCIKN